MLTKLPTLTYVPGVKGHAAQAYSHTCPAPPSAPASAPPGVYAGVILTPLYGAATYNQLRWDLLYGFPAGTTMIQIQTLYTNGTQKVTYFVVPDTPDWANYTASAPPSYLPPP